MRKALGQVGKFIGGLLKIPKVPAILYSVKLWHPLVKLSKAWDFGVDVGEYWPGGDSLDALAREEAKEQEIELGTAKPKRERSRVRTKKKIKEKELEGPEGPK